MYLSTFLIVLYQVTFFPSSYITRNAMLPGYIHTYIYDLLTQFISEAA